MSTTQAQKARLKNTALALGAIAVIAVILWIDITSGMWQEVVILSGLAAGLVTFLLTVFVLDKVLVRSAAKRWEPMNRLAFTEFLHALADEDRSEISRGYVVTRRLTPPELDHDDAYDDALHRVREVVVRERRLLADLLSRWAQFLASSGDNETVLLHIADIALALDTIRDETLTAESLRDEASHSALCAEIETCNQRLVDLSAELQGRLKGLSR